MAVMGRVEALELLQVAVDEHRRLEDDPVGVALGLVEDVLLAADAGGQRHDVALAQGVDGRVGDLGEHLAEVVVESAYPGGEHRHGGVVAHGAHRLLAALAEHRHHLLEFLVRPVEQLLVDEAGVVVEVAGAAAEFEIAVEGAQPPAALVHPAAVGVAALELAVDVPGSPAPPAEGVDDEQLAGADAALLHHLVGLVVPDADLGGEGDEVVAGDDVARRAQAIAIEPAGSEAPVAHDDARRAVPGLHVHRVEVVEGTQVVVHAGVVLPGRRHEETEGAEEVHAPSEKELEHIVEGGRIGAALADEGRRLGHVGQKRRAQLVGARPRPAAVTGDGVDLAIMGQIAEGMGQRPPRQGVGGKALVEEADGRLQPVVGEVGEELRQVHRPAQPLVDDDQVGEADDIEVGVVDDALLDPPLDHVEAALQLLGAPAEGAVEEYLGDGRHGGAGEFAEHRRVDRHLAPADQRQGLAGQLLLDDLAGGQLAVALGAEEDHADAIAAAEVPAVFGGNGLEKPVGFLQQQAAAVAAAPVGGDAATVGHARQRGDGGAHQSVAGLPPEVGDQAEATVILDIFRIVKTHLGPRCRENSPLPIRPLLTTCPPTSARPLSARNYGRIEGERVCGAKRGKASAKAQRETTDRAQINRFISSSMAMSTVSGVMPWRRQKLATWWRRPSSARSPRPR